MDVMESIRAAIQELILPGLDRIREENTEIKAILGMTNKRLDDVNLHLADQSRRIDETNKRIDEMRTRFDQRIDETNNRIDEMRTRFELRMDEMNHRLDRLYEVIVRRDEHVQLERRLSAVEHDLDEIKRKLAA